MIVGYYRGSNSHLVTITRCMASECGLLTQSRGAANPGFMITNRVYTRERWPGLSG